MLYKRSDSEHWWCRFTAPDGTRVQRSTRTVDRRQAQEFADTLKVQYWRMTQLGEKPRRTWQEAAERWVKETTRKSVVNDRSYLAFLNKYFGKLYLDQINRDLIDKVKYDKLKTGVTPSTVNRLLEVIRVILNSAAREWEWIERAPVVKLLRVDNRRIRWLTRNEAQRLLSHLPEHLQAMMRFSLVTGLRKANVVGLRWSQVDLARRAAWIHPDQSKNGRAIGVPLNHEAISLLRNQLGGHPTHCFSYQGRTVYQVNTKAWKKALRKAGIENFRWHDLRHTWASWHIQAGTPLHILQEMGGWSEAKMVRRYAHLAPEHLVPYADKLETVVNNEPHLATFFTTFDERKTQAANANHLSKKGKFGAPGEIRTPDQLVRSQLLYPTELQARG